MTETRGGGSFLVRLKATCRRAEALGTAVIAAVAAVVAVPGPVVAASGPLASTRVFLVTAAEVVLEVPAACDACSWERSGHEAPVLRIEVDGRYSQHLVLARGDEPAAYRVLLGALAPGEHLVTVLLDAAATPPATTARLGTLGIALITATSPDHAPMAHAPLLHARPGTMRRFSDVPLFMWYETARSERGTWIRYSVVFSNEDGGTPADRLMATWGRLTDIEYVYGVELDASGAVLAEEYQGPEHQMLPFKGTRTGHHPMLYVVTENNMVSDRGEDTERIALAPIAFDLTGVAREAVMDANPWLYRVSAYEAMREGRIDPDARPGSGKLPDPRRFVYVEACGELVGAAIAFDAGFGGDAASPAWAESDGGVAPFKIVRNGCFRAAVAAPAGAGALQALRFRAYRLPPREGEPLPTPGAASARIVRVNRAFRLRDDFTPGPNEIGWSGDLRLTLDGVPAPLVPAR